MTLIEFDSEDNATVLAAMFPSSPDLARRISLPEGTVEVFALHSGARQYGPQDTLRIAFEVSEGATSVALGVVAALIYDCMKAGVKSFRWEGRRHSPVDLAELRRVLALPLPDQTSGEDHS